MSYMRQETGAGVDPLGTPTHITIHWTAGNHDQVFDHYHFNVKGDGTVVQTLSTKLKGSHVWHRNTGNVGVAFCAMGDGFTITSAQIEAMARLVAELMGILGIPLGNVKDHVYWAICDGYGPGSGDPETRVDLTGTEAGRKVWSDLYKRIPALRQQLQTGEIPNSLVGVIN